MRIRRLTDEYELAGPVFGKTADELRRADAEPRLFGRWLAGGEPGAPVAGASVLLRPDGRVFVSFAGADPAVLPELLDEVQADVAETVWTVVDGDDSARVTALGSAGFRAEIVLDRFVVPFELAMSAVRRAWVPGDIRLLTADLAVEERLFGLDVEIRSDVPGTEGWRGDRAWFHGELTDDMAFEPSAYLVAVEEGTGDYVGLVRFWRNPGGPRLGLVGVTRRRRGSVLAAALLHRAMQAASTWGFATFATETARTNRSTRPLLARLGAEPSGHDLLMARRDEGRHAGD